MRTKSIIFTVILLAGSISNAGVISWSSSNLGADAEVGASLQAGWLVAMYRDVNENNSGSGSWFNDLRVDNSGVVTSSGLTADDVFLGFTTTLINPISSVITLAPGSEINVQPNGADVYSVIFDAADMGAASFFAVVDSNPFDVGSGGVGSPPNLPVSYSLGNNIAGDFQAIPEPTAAALLGVFGSSMLVVGRRLFSKRS